MLSAPSQVIVRNADYFEQGKWLLVNPTEAAVFAQLDNSQLYGFHQYLDIYQQCIANLEPEKHCFSASYQQHNDFDGAIIYMPKSKQQAAMLINNIAAQVKPGAQVFLVGENKSGINSAAKMFAQVSPQVNKVDSARHCALYCATIDNPATFDLHDWISMAELSVAQTTCKIAFMPGVFSVGEMDAGTELLLANLPNNLSGKVLDFACGAGVIGCFLKTRFPQIELTMSDVSAIAVHCSELSLKANQLEGQVIASNGLAEVDQQFDGIFTNPPFHTGLKTDYLVTDKFIEGAGKIMKSNARLTLVANRFLPYPAHLQDIFGNLRTVKQTNKFNLYQSIKK